MSQIITETNAPKKRMLSGIQPSGDLHVGNYLGAIKNSLPGFAKLAADYNL